MTTTHMNVDFNATWTFEEKVAASRLSWLINEEEWSIEDLAGYFGVPRSAVEYHLDKYDIEYNQ